ncbi:hypothetical protein BGX21_003228 [Mortierella sp. AD011]|nr:hypothetical protein BGX20_002345 [Mortierella sp. AD010]KAF9377256.1 hypothetical protein BGX21_003228 [Mortierella sp. AD011]
MTDNSFLSLIQRLNSGDSPSTATATSPSDHSDDLSLWTNAEFTFDMPPGFGIFDTDSGLNNNNNNNDIASTSTANPLTLTHNNDPILGHQPASSSSSSLDLLSLTPSQTEPRALSLLERTRQRNPLQDENTSQQQQQQQPKLELQEQLAAINSFHSLLAAYSAAQTQQQQQQQQQQIHQQQTQEYPSIQPAAVTVAPVSTAAPTTPAAAKLLRQPMPKYDKPAFLSKKEKLESSPSTTQSIESASQDIAASNVVTSDENDDVEETEQQSGAGPLTLNDDPDNQTPKLTPQEDKRRRNTAASARFRQKKKLREQALEQTAQEQAARAASLEARVKELEMEVRWLRGLIVEKDSRLHEATVSLADSKRIRLESP